MKFVKKLLRLAKRSIERQRLVVYWGPFRDEAALHDHWERARWYFNALSDATVAFIVSPQLIGAARDLADERRLIVPERYAPIALARAKLLLLHDRSPIKFPSLTRPSAGILRVEQRDLEIEEYQNYCRAAWDLLTEQEQTDFQLRQQRKFERFRVKIGGTFPHACVFGNGPTLAFALTQKFNDSFRIVANTSFLYAELMDRIRPHAIVCGDTVWHLGANAHGAAFRRDLLSFLKSNDCYLFVPLPEAFVLSSCFAEVEERVIFVSRGAVSSPSFDLGERFLLNRSISVLNVLMLPIAATFSRELILYGIDGRGPKITGSDIWDHVTQLEYPGDLRKAALDTHPTYNLWREKRDEVSFFYRETERMVAAAEAQGITISTALPSHVPVLRGRARYEDSR